MKQIRATDLSYSVGDGIVRALQWFTPETAVQGDLRLAYRRQATKK